MWDTGADLGSGLFKTSPRFLVKVAGAHTFTLEGRDSSLLPELHMHANPSHHCLGVVRNVSSGIMQTLISIGLDVTI